MISFDPYKQGFSQIQCTEENLQETIEKVATVVSHIYAQFPLFTLKEREQLLENYDIDMYEVEHKTLPTKEQCAEFESKMKEWIITSLDIQDSYRCSTLNLRADHGPLEAYSEFIKPFFTEQAKEGSLWPLFPRKSFTSIQVWHEIKLINLRLF